MAQNDIKAIHDACNSYAEDARVYQFVLQERLFIYARWLNIVRVLGLIIPLTLGVILLAYSPTNKYLPELTGVGVLLAAIQFIVAAVVDILDLQNERVFYAQSMQELAYLKDEFLKHKNWGSDDLNISNHSFALTRQQYQRLLGSILTYHIRPSDLAEARRNLRENI